ncbi:MAG: hypothetical protein LBP75_10145 [Planctomycetota bacterium]|jgi:hypothetical protein|nr:hypothetical protein [Planctomycetota bacterium]
MRKRIYFLGALILCGGILIGACGMFFCQRHFHSRHAPPPPEALTERVAERLTARYALTPAGAEKVRAALAPFFRHAEQARREFMTQIDAGNRQLAEQMRQVLSPENFADWQRRVAKFQPAK